MKRCCTCKELKPLEDFHKRKDSPDGRTRRCKSCQKLQNARHYANNPEPYKQRATARMHENLAWYNEFKKSLKCQSCGTDKPWRLAFHHRDPSEKDFTISQVLTSYTIERILEEISKCDVLCHNCHADEHERLKHMPLV